MTGKMLWLAVLALASMPAFAAETDNNVTFHAGAFSAKSEDSRLVTIFDNFANKYPKALYLDDAGESLNVTQLGVAIPFTPTANHTVTEIEVAMSYSTNYNQAVLGLYTDANGVPGTALKTWNVRHMPHAGKCCVVMAKTDKAGIPIVAGQQYWVAVSRNPTHGTVATWDFNAVDQIDPSPLATNDLSIGWVGRQTVAPQPAFAVRGSN